MSSSKTIFRYYRRIYWQSNKWVMPLIGWLIFLYLNYLFMPQEFTSTMLNSATVIFLLTAWTTQTFLASLDPVMEQIVVTRLPKKGAYWAQPVVFVSWLSLVFSLVSVTLPTVINFIQSQGLFRRGIAFEEVLCGFLIHLMFSLIGGVLALISQPRYLFRDAKISNLFLVLVALVGVVGQEMAEKVPGFDFILWLFPPLSTVINVFLESKEFSLLVVLSHLISCFIYVSVLIVGYRFLREKFLYD